MRMSILGMLGLWKRQPLDILQCSVLATHSFQLSFKVDSLLAPQNTHCYVSGEVETQHRVQEGQE